MVFFLVEFVVKLFLVGSVGLLTIMVIFSGIVLFHLFFEICENPLFHDLLRMDKANWEWIRRIGLGAYSGMVGFLCSLVLMVPPPGLLMHLKVLLIWLRLLWVGLITEWSLSDEFDHDSAASSLTDLPDVWTDDSLVLDHLTGVSSSGSGFFAHQAEHFWRGRRWSHVDGIRLDPDLACCKGFCSVPGPLQSVQRAEMWGDILALQTSRAVHLGVDNLGVVRHIGRLLGGCRGTKPLELDNDGDLL